MMRALANACEYIDPIQCYELAQVSREVIGRNVAQTRANHHPITATELFERACYETRLSMLLHARACILVICADPRPRIAEILRAACRYDDVALAHAYYPNFREASRHTLLPACSVRYAIIEAARLAKAARVYRDFTCAARAVDPQADLWIASANCIYMSSSEGTAGHGTSNPRNSRIWNTALITRDPRMLARFICGESSSGTETGKPSSSDVRAMSVAFWLESRAIPTSPSMWREFARAFLDPSSICDTFGEAMIVLAATRYIHDNPNTWSCTTLREITRDLPRIPCFMLMFPVPTEPRDASHLESVGLTDQRARDIPGTAMHLRSVDHIIAIGECGLRIEDPTGSVISFLITHREVSDLDADYIITHVISVPSIDRYLLWYEIFRGLVEARNILRVPCNEGVVSAIMRSQYAPDLGPYGNALIGAVIGSRIIAQSPTGEHRLHILGMMHSKLRMYGHGCDMTLLNERMRIFNGVDIIGLIEQALSEQP
jgi:hypothetical protein